MLTNSWQTPAKLGASLTLLVGLAGGLVLPLRRVDPNISVFLAADEAEDAAPLQVGPHQGPWKLLS